MKRVLTILFSVAIVASAFAQNSYDAMRLVDNDLVGTARFVGMGGAMSALGTDISVISTNPAGIGLYRSNDIVMSLGMNTTKNSADFGGYSVKSDKNSFAINNLGFVLAKEMEVGSVKFVNIAANYRRSNNLANRFDVMGSLLHGEHYFSQQYRLHEMYLNDGYDFADHFDYTDYTSYEYPWLGLLASTSGLLDYDGNLYYVPGNEDGLYPTMMEYFSTEKGGVNDIDVNISCNINDRVYLGFTVGATYVDYTRTSEYSEFDEMGNNYYTLQNNYNVKGNGINVKFGAIFRPFESSPFKVGVAVHTPTWYSLTDRTSAAMLGGDGYVYDTRDADCYGGDLFVDYDFTTPWRLNLSTSYTFGKYAAVNAEYEYVDYSTAKLKYTDGGKMDFLNEDIEANMKAQHIFRLGALFNVSNNFSLRCGYNHITAPFKEEAVKVNMLYTDTNADFTNRYETNIVTFGAGYSNKGWYADVAYKLAMQKCDFYNYYDSKFLNPCAYVSTNRSSVILSVGYRF